MQKAIDVSKYVKAPKKTSRLNERHTVPISEDMKVRIEKLSGSVKINQALRDYLEELLSAAEKVERVA
jgi:DNA-directed RNA polymerase subunit L